MMFFSFERNSSSVLLFCGFGLGFIPYPQNKNCKISALTTPKPCNFLQRKSTRIVSKMLLYLVFNGGQVVAEFVLPIGRVEFAMGTLTLHPLRRNDRLGGN